MLRTLAFLISRIFFRNIYISGTPYTGPSSIWAGNHTSGIVDPAVIFSQAPVSLRPLAKSTLWNNPALKPLLELSRSIPVFRIQDMMKDEKAKRDNERPSNTGAFSAVTESLLAGDKILIFPEGVSHDDPYIHRLKTGVARMAIQAIATADKPNFSVTIQPFSIDYFEKDEFRSDVAIHFGEPIIVNDKDIPVNKLMAQIAEGISENYASFFTWDEKRNWLFIYEIIVAEDPKSAREFRLFVEKYREQFDRDVVLMARLQTMRRMLGVLNLSPRQLVWAGTHDKKRSVFALILSNIWFHFLVAVPLEFLAALMWYLPYRICGKLAEASTKDRDVLATMKIAHGAWIFPSWALLITSLFYFGTKSFWPELNFLLVLLVSFLIGPLVLVFSTLATEKTHFLPGYWRLAYLRLFHPRRWREVVIEWREIVAEAYAKTDLTDKSRWVFGDEVAESVPPMKEELKLRSQHG